MIVDTSALAAVMFNEPDADRLRAMLLADGATLSAPNLLELTTVVDRRGSAELSTALTEVLTTLRVSIAPFTEQHALIGRAAYRRFGRGSGHPAQLNFGDCMSYALSVVSGEPLLFVGDDFAQTDVASAL